MHSDVQGDDCLSAAWRFSLPKVYVRCLLSHMLHHTSVGSQSLPGSCRGQAPLGKALRPACCISSMETQTMETNT